MCSTSFTPRDRTLTGKTRLGGISLSDFHSGIFFLHIILVSNLEIIRSFHVTRIPRCCSVVEWLPSMPKAFASLHRQPQQKQSSLSWLLHLFLKHKLLTVSLVFHQRDPQPFTRLAVHWRKGSNQTFQDLLGYWFWTDAQETLWPSGLGRNYGGQVIMEFEVCRSRFKLGPVVFFPQSQNV